MTEKEKIEVQRDAFVAGVIWSDRSLNPSMRHHMPTIEAQAREVYPDPVRPRVVKINGEDVRFVDGQFEYFARGSWKSSGVTPEWVSTYAELMASPTEPVED